MTAKPQTPTPEAILAELEATDRTIYALRQQMLTLMAIRDRLEALLPVEPPQNAQ